MWQSIKNVYHLFNAVLVNIWFGFPGKKLTVIGVTGTDGKTTTVHLIYHILKHAGKKACMISSIGAAIDDQVYDTGFHVTTPSSFALQKYIKKAVDNHVEYLVLEVTSHALDQYRVWGVPFAIAVLTNISHEHLDYHKNFDHYVSSKVKLLSAASVAVVNRDDESYDAISKIKDQPFDFAQGESSKLITFGLKDNADVNPKKFTFGSKLMGEFNTYNVLAAIAVCRQLNIRDIDIRKAIDSFVPPDGRQQVVYDKEFRIIVDFAHTPNAFLRLLSEIEEEKEGRLIHVFGAAGERDHSKRPLMGKISSKFADVIVLTSEDPRSEGSEPIMAQIERGISSAFSQVDPELASPLFLKEKFYVKISDRKAAIDFAVSIAKEKDEVLITGKGHEKSMSLGHGEEPWDEVEVVKEAIKQSGL